MGIQATYSFLVSTWATTPQKPTSQPPPGPEETRHHGHSPSLPPTTPSLAQYNNHHILPPVYHHFHAAQPPLRQRQPSKPSPRPVQPQSLLRLLTSPPTSHLSCRLPSPPAPSPRPTDPSKAMQHRHTDSTWLGDNPLRYFPCVVPQHSAQCSRRRGPFCPRPRHRGPHRSKHHRPRPPAQGRARPDPARGYSRCPDHPHGQQAQHVVPRRHVHPSPARPTLPLHRRGSSHSTKSSQTDDFRAARSERTTHPPSPNPNPDELLTRIPCGAPS